MTSPERRPRLPCCSPHYILLFRDNREINERSKRVGAMCQEKYYIEGRLAFDPGRVKGNSPKRKTGKIQIGVSLLETEKDLVIAFQAKISSEWGRNRVI